MTAARERIEAALSLARRRTLSLVEALTDAELERVHSPLMSPLVWDLGHIAAYEDLWLVHRHGGEPLLRPDLAPCYDAFETPRAQRGDIELLGPAQARAYLEAVRRRVLEVTARRGVGDGFVHEMVIAHEHQHNETMLQTLTLARLAGRRSAAMAPAPGGRQVAGSASSAPSTGLEMVAVDEGPVALGAPTGRFSFDNERPRHTAHVSAFRIGRTPISNAAWLSFADGGGYERREWWSADGWAWKQQHDISRPQGWCVGARPEPAGHGGVLAATDGAEEARAVCLGGEPVYEWRLSGWEALVPDRPVIHISWFEADAFTRACGARLPTEGEWEKAATGLRDGAAHANLFERGSYGTERVGSHPGATAPCGATGMLGDVWEWTASTFQGYPGFVAHPYHEYSAAFFGDAYRVLRGGSWATSERLASPTTRNWDLPQRRQIFAGLRIAADA